MADFLSRFWNNLTNQAAGVGQQPRHYFEGLAGGQPNNPLGFSASHGVMDPAGGNPFGQLPPGFSMGSGTEPPPGYTATSGVNDPHRGGMGDIARLMHAITGGRDGGIPQTPDINQPMQQLPQAPQWGQSGVPGGYQPIHPLFNSPRFSWMR